MLSILFRVENNALDRIRTLSPNCEIDAGGVPVHWLNDVQPAQSIALLTSLVPERERTGERRTARHRGARRPFGGCGAGALPRARPAANHIRLRAVSYLGAAQSELVKKVIASDPDSRVRERAVSSLGKQPSTRGAGPADLDREDPTTTPRLRLQAVSGLGRKSGAKVVATLTGIVENDRDTNVKRRALSSLQSMPDGEGVPVLIQLAKTQRDPELRKQAMTSLQHSRDPRALAFFEEVIKK